MTVNSQSPITKNLKILEINVNSLILLSRRHTLQTFINSQNPDIVLLNETKLNQRHKLYFDNFDLIRRDRPNQ